MSAATGFCTLLNDGKEAYAERALRTIGKDGRVKTVKGVKTSSYSGCGSVVLVEETAKAIAALDIAAG